MVPGGRERRQPQKRFKNVVKEDMDMEMVGVT